VRSATPGLLLVVLPGRAGFGDRRP
jgi:hypothetical protein